MKTIQGAWSTIASIVGRALDLDPFWSVWLTAVVGVIVGMRLLGGPWSDELGTGAIPFYLLGIGAVSIVYALLLEAVPRRGAPDQPTIECAPANLWSTHGVVVDTTSVPSPKSHR